MTVPDFGWRVRCHAHSSRTGNPCRQYAIAGGYVCRTHGGATAIAQEKARERLEMAKLRTKVQRLVDAEQRKIRREREEVARLLGRPVESIGAAQVAATRVKKAG